MFILVLQQCHRESEDKWKRLSRQVADVILPMLAKQQVCALSVSAVRSLWCVCKWQRLLYEAVLVTGISQICFAILISTLSVPVTGQGFSFILSDLLRLLLSPAS